MLIKHCTRRSLVFLSLLLIIVRTDGFFLKPVFADNVLTEEFDGQWSDQSKWSFPNNQDGFTFPTGENFLKLSMPNGQKFAYAFSNDPFPDENITISIRFKFSPSGLNFGAGILLSENAPISEIFQDPNPHAIIKIWPLSNTKFRLMSNLCSVDNPGCGGKTFIVDITGEAFFDWHNLLIDFDENDQYHISLDGTLLFSSVITTRKPRQIMLGTPEVTAGVTWPIFEVDYVRVTSGGSGGGSKTPIVMLPGMGSSWDMDAILEGVSGNSWAIPDFVDAYDNLIASFENAGYVIDTDLFIFAYDWRKNLTSLADDLDIFMEDLVSTGKIGASDKVDLVGHSMGGLVARSYLQEHGDGKTNKLITAGSPHLGAVDIYSIWEGATVIDRPWWQKVAIELLVRLNRQPGENKVTTVRRLLPAAKDLLPTYDFLLLNGALKPWGDLAQKNIYLNSISDISEVDNLTKVTAGSGETTKYQINAITRNYKDVMAGKWKDGKILSFVTADGDGTVWLDSAKGDFTTQQVVSANHTEVISNTLAIGNIFSELGLDTDKVLTDTTPDIRDSVLAVILRSPGTLEVCEGIVCNSSLGWYFPTHKLFLLPGFSGQLIDVKVSESGLGDYDLHIGKLSATTESWKKIEGRLSSTGQEDFYQVTNTVNQLDVLQMGVTSENGLEMTVALLESVEPGWDMEGDIDKVIDGNLSILDRLKAARKIRYSLIDTVKKTHLESGFETIERSVRVWISLDRFMEILLTNDAYISADQASRSLQTVPHYKQGVEDILVSSSSYYAGEFLAEADRQNHLAETLELGQETLRLDKLHSARYLYLLSLNVRN